LSEEDWRLEEVARLTNDGVDEPLPHALFREAWQQREENPRTALAMGYAAAEVGVKQCIASLMPHAELIVMNFHSPRLQRVLGSLLPEVLKNFGRPGASDPPPKSMAKEIGKVGNARNQLIHRGDLNISKEKLEKHLRTIRDLLYLLDYYNGHDWALENLSDTVRMALGS